MYVYIYIFIYIYAYIYIYICIYIYMFVYRVIATCKVYSIFNNRVNSNVKVNTVYFIGF